jgi:hypothetical protein
MKTKAHLAFHARIAHFDADLELVDVFSIAVKAGKLASTTHLFDGVVKKRHPRLANRIINKHNQDIAIGHLANTLYVSFIKDIFEDFTAYLSEIVRCCAARGLAPGRLIGEHHFQIDANDLLDLGNWDAVVAKVSGTLFRNLEKDQSTIKLIKAIDKKLSLKLDDKILAAAMPYLDLRHILIHRDGFPDQKFCTDYPQFSLTADKAINVGFKMVSDARSSIVALLNHIDGKVVPLVLPSAIQ